MGHEMTVRHRHTKMTANCDLLRGCYYLRRPIDGNSPICKYSKSWTYEDMALPKNLTQLPTFYCIVQTLNSD